MKDNGNGELLRVEDLHVSFGAVTALSGVDFEVREKEILAIIGPNGAGKTCVLNCITGFYRPNNGKIYYKEKNITNFPSYKIVSLGITRTFQNIELFTGLTTLENLMAGRHIHMKHGSIAGSLYFGRARNEEIKHREVVEEIIDLLELEPFRKQVVGSLPYGQRKRVDLGRALALEPNVLLLDEPMAGMNVEEKEDMARFILDIHELKEISIVMIEHDMGVIMDIADRIIVLDFGEKIAEGLPQDIKVNPKVITAYLGS